MPCDATGTAPHLVAIGRPPGFPPVGASEAVLARATLKVDGG